MTTSMRKPALNTPAVSTPAVRAFAACRPAAQPRAHKTAAKQAAAIVLELLQTPEKRRLILLTVTDMGGGA